MIVVMTGPKGLILRSCAEALVITTINAEPAEHAEANPLLVCVFCELCVEVVVR